MTRRTIDEKELLATVKAHVDEEVQHLRDQLTDKDKELAEYRKSHGSMRAAMRQVAGAIEPMKPLPREYRDTKAAKRVSSTCAVVSRATDWHHGAVQQADEIEGFNSFNPAISERRQLGYMAKVINSTEMHRSYFHLPTLHHICTGDLISGDIHDELRITNAWPSPVQAVRAGELLARQVALAAPHYEHVYVEFVCDDNHSRLVKKPQAKEAGLNTMNFVVGSIAQALLRDTPNVTFTIYPVHEKVVKVLTRQ